MSSETRLNVSGTAMAGPSGADAALPVQAAAGVQIASASTGLADKQNPDPAISESCFFADLDPQGRIVQASPRFLDIAGRGLEEMLGQHYGVFLKDDQGGSPVRPEAWAALCAGTPQTARLRCMGAAGQEAWLQAGLHPVQGAQGWLSRIVLVASDITADRMRQLDFEGQVVAIRKSHAVISFDMNGVILDANQGFLDAVGYELSEIQGRHHRIFVEPSYAQGADYAAFWRRLAQGQHHAGQYRRFGRGGREIWLQATYNPVIGPDGRPVKVVKYATVATEETLRQAEHQGQIAALHKAVCVISFGLDGTILDANENFLAMMGYRQDEVIGHHHRTMLEPGQAETPDYAEFWAMLRAGQFHSGLYKRIGKNGRVVWIQASYNPILDLNGRPFKIIKFATDVTSNVALAEAFEDAKRQAQHDAATSLPNRVRLNGFMAASLAHPEARLAVLYLDLDRFKPINDTYGHQAGDQVLGEVANRLRRSLGQDQLAARVGGDEFVVAAPGLSDEQTEALCQKLIDAVTAPIRHDGNQLRVGVSIGVAISPIDGVTPDELLRCADAALYSSKKHGRGTFSFHSSTLNNRLLAYRNLVEEMRRGLEAGEFFLEYQPRFDTRGRSVRSVEALVRWNHPQRGRIGPVDFIPIAERSGLIMPLGEWVLRTACEAAAQWSDIGVSVNVSPVQIHNTDVVALVKRVVEETGFEACRLEVEITEGVLLQDAHRARMMLGGLKALGVKLAMDDFGTGYSSLSSLRSFPFDVIKIDRQFITDMEDRDGGREVVQAILGLGRALGLSVTAEGVETVRQLTMLTADDCIEVQGYLLAHPMSAESVSRLLASRGDDHAMNGRAA